MHKSTIGLEIHSELKTRTKMFCDCRNNSDEITPNLNVCPICLAHPGTLPKINKAAVDFVVKTGIALNCSINRLSKFDRKNYFYPDLPKAYQISQYDKPICIDGRFTLPTSKKTIRIKRIHLEEDTAKLSHAADGKHSLVDFNRAGVPLMELVTEPDFGSADEVVEFAQEFQLILRQIGVSDADMEKGHMRIEANTSMSKEGEGLGTKVEVKNLNSFKAVQKSIEYEIERQTKILGRGEKVIQETRGWDESKQNTFSQRSKEEAHDYRYFPEPDLPPMNFDDKYIEMTRGSMPELPSQKRERFSSEYNLSESQVGVLIKELYFCDFFEKSVSELKGLGGDNIELIYNYLTSDVKGIESETGINLYESKLLPLHLAQTVFFLTAKKISSRSAKDILKKAFLEGISPEDIAKQEGLDQISNNSDLEPIIKGIIDKNNKVCYNYKQGKENAIKFLVGKVMSETKGRANPEVAETLLKKYINENSR